MSKNKAQNNLPLPRVPSGVSNQFTIIFFLNCHFIHGRRSSAAVLYHGHISLDQDACLAYFSSGSSFQEFRIGIHRELFSLLLCSGTQNINSGAEEWPSSVPCAFEREKVGLQERVGAHREAESPIRLEVTGQSSFHGNNGILEVS